MNTQSNTLVSSTADNALVSFNADHGAAWVESTVAMVAALEAAKSAKSATMGAVWARYVDLHNAGVPISLIVTVANKLRDATKCSTVAVYASSLKAFVIESALHGDLMRAARDEMGLIGDMVPNRGQCDKLVKRVAELESLRALGVCPSAAGDTSEIATVVGERDAALKAVEKLSLEVADLRKSAGGDVIAKSLHENLREQFTALIGDMAVLRDKLSEAEKQNADLTAAAAAAAKPVGKVGKVGKVPTV